MNRPLASLSLDMDNQWSYMKTHGDPGWERFPSYLELFIPRILTFLRERELSITFFIVGQDAVQPQHRDLLREIAKAGHEIGNHSFHHEQWLHLYSETEIDSELARTEDALEDATGLRPRGFRGPGFSVSAAVLKTLARRGYQYDASTFPTFLGPLARAYYFATSKNLSPEEMAKRKQLFGKLHEGFRPLNPYRWRLPEGSLLEIPVTTMPIFKVPFHASYLLYLACYNRLMALTYFRWAMLLCRLTGTQPSLLLHPLDFLGGDDVAGLDFFPAMRLAGARKMALMAEIVDLYNRHFMPVPMCRHAEAVARSAHMQEIRPRF